MAADELTPGTVLDGTYELSAQLGAGGMGVVWRAKHLRLPKEVAVKVLRGVLGDEPDAYARFRREAEIASQLGHPNIVEALDFNILPDGAPYLVLELLRGRSLRQVVAQGSLTVERTLLIASQIAAGLRAAHRRGIVHRDLKPENVFLCQQEQEDAILVKILDFGISKIHSSQSLQTREGVLMGTPHYMAPEQATGGEVDARTDQFALAAMIYEMLTGRAPFFAEQPLQVLYQVVHSEPAPPSTLRGGLPVAVDAVLLRALAKTPSQRFDDVAQLLRELWQASGMVAPREALALLSSTTHEGAATPRDAENAATLASDRGALSALGNAPTIDSGRVLTGPPRAASTGTPPHTGPQPLGAAEAALLANAPTIAQAHVRHRGAVVAVGSGDGGASIEPAGRSLGLVIVVAVVASLGGGAVVWWLSLTPPAVVVARRLDFGAAAQPDATTVRSRPADARTRSVDARTRSVGARPRSVDARPQPRDLIPDQLRPVDKHPGKKPKKPRVKHVPLPPLTAELRRRVTSVERLLNQRDFDGAILQAERLLRDLPPVQQWRAHRLLTLGYCGKQELTNAKAHFRLLPRGAVQNAAHARCRRFGTPFER